MPIYEFICAGCQNRFEALGFNQASFENLECPECGGGDVAKALSAFAVSAGANSSAIPSCETAGACATPNIPGCKTGMCGL